MLEIHEYFEGRVKSIGFDTADLPATVGVMSPGDYEFATSKKETMTVVSGELVVRLPGESEWKSFPAGSHFGVEAEQRFQLKVRVSTAYLCTYE